MYITHDHMICEEAICASTAERHTPKLFVYRANKCYNSPSLNPQRGTI